jgi:predicted dehydrogenase
VHAIEPARALLGEPSPVASHDARTSNGATRLHVAWESGVEAEFATLGEVEAPIELRVLGERGERTLTFTDSFAAFRAALERFLAVVRGEAEPIPETEVLRVVGLIELGMASGAP